MILHQALRYLVLTRWRNRIRSVLRKLRTPTGILAALVFLAVVAAIVLGAGMGRDMTPAVLASTFVAILAFLMVMGILGGIGQRGFVFVAADLDFVFPTPIPRRQILVYHFVPHYLGALFMGVVFLGVIGGRFMPHPLLFLLAFTLCQVMNAHLSALAAEVSMALGDRLYGRLRGFSTALLVSFTLASMIFVVGGIAGIGDITGILQHAIDSPVAQVVFYPAVKAVHAGLHPDAGVRLLALGILAGCAVGSFLLVVALRVDFVEASFNATKKAWKKVDQMRRGVHRKRGVKRSAGGPQGRWFRGAGAVLWLNALTMRRQLRAMLGGLIVVLVMLAVFSREQGGATLAHTVLVMLGMVPLWMPLPIGFRLPREQLLVLRELPIAPARLACALLTVAVLVPFLLQSFAVVLLAALGRLDPLLALAVLPAYAAVGYTMICVESFFVLKRPHPNSINLLHSLTQVMLQLAALLPGMFTAALVQALDGGLPGAVLVGTLGQVFVVYGLARWLGRRLQTGDVATA